LDAGSSSDQVLFRSHHFLNFIHRGLRSIEKTNLYITIFGFCCTDGTKSQLHPTTRMVHLGFGNDSTTTSFYLPDKKRDKFHGLRESLSSGVGSLHDIQSFMGKCNSLRLVFPAASLFSQQCCCFMASLLEVGSTSLSSAVLEEIVFWRFMDSVTRPVAWRREQHVQLCLSSDASPFAWGSTVVFGDKKMSLRDYFSADLCASRDMCFKESLALYYTLQSVGTWMSLLTTKALWMHGMVFELLPRILS
jgi:hypothetical protein